MSESELIKDLIEQPAKVYIDKNDYQQGFIDGVNQMVKELGAERQTGEWVNDENHIPICSKCGYIPQYDRAIDDYEYSNFCPSCGAKMEHNET